ncbi:MAG: hypothetical protein CMO43_13995 [Verrucomicrobiales bacterium]|jgi:hypothetical protein|nr:hypothetical protein [Verrucomicrobiales bacterium]MDP6421120.1 hypothetical protein [SAR202 cluster bacterium]|tara:strand:+ start:36 stop:1082 length:1047 start_codon:yes stop_codon:yes gene_type:complete
MATHTATALDLATDEAKTDSRNYWSVLEGWWETDRRDGLTPIAQLTFAALLHMANRRWFPNVMDVDKKELEALVGHSRESVRRALAQLTDVGLIHLAATTGRGRVQVCVRYEEFQATRAPRRGVRPQYGREKVVRAQYVQNETAEESPETQLQRSISADSWPTQVQDSRETPDCPGRTTSVSEVGGDLRDGSICPRCQEHPLAVRFKTDPSARTKQRFLACSGYESGGCSGFTWSLGSTAYQPSRRILSQALVGAQYVPGRPPLVRDTQCDDGTSATEDNHRPTTLEEVLHSGRYLPAELLLDELARVDMELADHHRSQGSERNVILRDVKTRAAAAMSPITVPTSSG